MPTYDYHCTSCGHRLEAFQKITDEPLKACEACGKDSLQRGPGGGIGLQFKGSGFYINDYASNANRETSQGCCPCGKNENSCSNQNTSKK